MTDKLRVLESLARASGNSVIQWAADEIARLREERRAGELTHRDPLPEVPAARAAETVRIRVAVAIDRNGKWTAHAWGDKGGLIESESEIINVAQEMMGDGPGDAVRWVEADIPVPLPTSGEAIRGEVQG